MYFFLFIVSYFCKDSYSELAQQLQYQHPDAVKKRKQPQKSPPRKRRKKSTSSLVMPSDAEMETSESEDNIVNEEGAVYEKNMKKIKSLLNFVKTSDLFPLEQKKEDATLEERNQSYSYEKIKSFMKDFEQSNLFGGIISVVQKRSSHLSTNPMSAVLSEVILKEFFQWWQTEMNDYYELISSTDEEVVIDEQMNEKYSSVLTSLEMMKNFYFIFFQFITQSASSPPPLESKVYQVSLLQQKLLLIILNNFCGSTSSTKNKEMKNFSILDYLVEEISQFEALRENIFSDDCAVDCLKRFPLLLPAITSTHSAFEENSSSHCYFHSIFVILRMMNEVYEYLLQNDREFIECYEKKFQQFCKSQKKLRDLLEKKVLVLVQRLLSTLSEVCFELCRFSCFLANIFLF
jgi:hypothetical protein